MFEAGSGILGAIENRLLEATASDVQTIRAAAEHIISSGGKRVRPRFAVLMGELMGAPQEMIGAMGAAVELVHTATLLHDDIVDHSDMRRGKPSAASRFGSGVAVLAGDFVLTQALHGLTQQRLFAATHEMANAVRELVEAELLQLESAYALATPLEVSRRIASGKTGALFAWCARAPAAELGLPPDAVAGLDAVGRTLGYAFQVADDLLDFAGVDTGKPQAKDLREGLLTVPVQLARAREPGLDAAIARAFASRAEADFSAAYEHIAASHAAGLARDEIAACRERIVTDARRWLPAPERLGEFFDTFVSL